MRLRAIITIDLDAADFVDAAEHQRRIEDALQKMRGTYPNAALDFRERRQARRKGLAASPSRQGSAAFAATRKLNSYVD